MKVLPFHFPSAPPLDHLLVRHRWGRVMLHLRCLWRGGHRDWHWAGVKRELFSRRG